MLRALIIIVLISNGFGLSPDEISLSVNYFAYKNVIFVCYLSCEEQLHNIQLSTELLRHNRMMAVTNINKGTHLKLEKILRHWNVPIGVLIDGSCYRTDEILHQASKLSLLDSVHAWLVLLNQNSNRSIDGLFQHLNLSIDADIIVATDQENYYELTDVFNFGKIQGNLLEINSFGIWSDENGLKVWLKGFKYYSRWDFHNLTLRAISVILGGKPANFTPNLLSDTSYTAGISAMTKISAQILNVFKDMHNFRFNYTIADRWVGSPKPHSTLAVTNALYWKQQDISITCVRIFPSWLEWMDPFFPPTTFLETKFYYLIPENGIGDFENRFLTPMSPSVWWCTLAAGFGCASLLTIAAMLEKRSSPAYYAVFSVLAAACQQAYEDGVKMMDSVNSGQGRRLILLVLGLTSMLLYNYYTSSVVSWLLNAAAPTIATMDGLINSDLELTFEDIGYTRSWLDGPGFYYYSGFKWVKEDELRDKKVQTAKRTVPFLQPVDTGVELVRTGKYAYHTEPYTASQVIAPRFNERELCELGELQMMPPSMMYIVGQKRSPYREFFVWSLMRGYERGHITAARARIDRAVPGCAGRTPRALALGQAAPAFAVLAFAVVGSLLIMGMEIVYYRYRTGAKRSKINKRRPTYRRLLRNYFN